MSSDKQLHVTQSPRAVHDDVTGQWFIELSCGNFTYTDHPPWDVEWLVSETAGVNGEMKWMTA